MAPRTTVSLLTFRRRIVIFGLVIDALTPATLVANSGLDAMSRLHPSVVLAIAIVGSLWLLYLVRVFSHFIVMGPAPGPTWGGPASWRSSSCR